MVARTMTQEAIRLTPQNHPENAVPPEKPATLTLGSSVCICMVSALAGATVGSAALSTIFLMDERGHLASMVPLVAAVVSILGGWIGTFFWMCRDEEVNSRN